VEVTNMLGEVDVAWWPVLLAGAGAVIAGGLQSTLGFGASFVLVPALAVAAPRLLPGVIVVAIVPLSIVMLVTRRTRLDVAAVGRVTLARLPGIALGGAIVAVLSPRSLTVAIAVVLLLAVASVASGWEVEVTRTSEVVAGIASGVTGTAAALGGPPLALLFRGSAGEVLRSTLAGVWLAGSLPVLVALALAGSLTPEQVRVGALVGLAAVGGLVLARPLLTRLSERTLRSAVLWWAGAGALAALVRAVLGG
jgi:uncharacterized protein